MGVTWLDLAIPLALLLLSLFLSPWPAHLLNMLASRPSRYGKAKAAASGRADAGAGISADKRRSPSGPAGFVVPTQIHHARMYPADATHQFRYPGLYLAFELRALERGDLDCAPGFAWDGDQSQHKFRRRWAATKLSPDGFGRKVFPGVSNRASKTISNSLLLKLVYELRMRNYVEKGPQDVNEATLSGSERQPWDEFVGQVWAIAMPSVFGLAGFNPLTVYYVYRPEPRVGLSSRGILWLAVLEVHNTFNERHIYICEAGGFEEGNPSPDATSEAKVDFPSDVFEHVSSPRRGYDHFWHFPRTFHVSPFNDRRGYYQLFLGDMWPNGSELPIVDVRLLLMTEEGSVQVDGEAPSLQKKLMATLTSSKARSAAQKPWRTAHELTAQSMAVMLAAQPFDLFLPVARIMWEAAKLHWSKRLPVFVRPEPHGDAWSPQKSTDGDGSPYNGIGWPYSLSPVGPKLTSEEKPTTKTTTDLPSNQMGESARSGLAQRAAAGGIFWNGEASIETQCRRAIEKVFARQTRRGVVRSITVRSRNPEVPDYTYREGRKTTLGKDGQGEGGHSSNDDNTETGLTFYTLSSALYVDLCLYTPNQAHLFGSQAERTWGVNSLDAYMRVMNVPCHITTESDVTVSVRTVKWLRKSFVQWALRKSQCPSAPTLSRTNKADHVAGQFIVEAASCRHPLEGQGDGEKQHTGYPLSLVVALAAHIALLRLVALISALANVRYVRPPWAAVADGYRLALLRSEATEPISADFRQRKS